MNNKVILGAIIALSVALIAILIVVCIGLDEYREPMFRPHSSMDETVISGDAQEVFPEGENSSEGSEYNESESNNHASGNANNPSENKPSSGSSSVSTSSGPSVSGSGITSRPSSGSSSSDSSSENSSSGSSSESSSSAPDFDPDSKPTELLTYEEYIALSGEEQQKYLYSFPSPQAFFDWYNDAKAKYEAENPSIEIGGDEEIDLGDIIGGNP